MKPKWPISRPTEREALRRISGTAAPEPEPTAVFCALLDACAVDDRHGLNLFGRRIIRGADPTH